MHIIRSWQEFADWLKGPTCYAIAALLNTRRAHLEQYGDLSDLGSFVIIEPGDTLEQIETMLGFPLIEDMTPAFEWVERHGDLFEIPVVVSDDGFGHLLIVPDAEGIDPKLLALCHAYA